MILEHGRLIRKIQPFLQLNRDYLLKKSTSSQGVRTMSSAKEADVSKLDNPAWSSAPTTRLVRLFPTATSVILVILQ
jgi:hypothetical protein